MRRLSDAKGKMMKTLIGLTLAGIVGSGVIGLICSLCSVIQAALNNVVL